MTNAQVWFALIAGAVLVFIAIMAFADAVKGHPPKSDAKATAAAAADPWDMRRVGGPGA